MLAAGEADVQLLLKQQAAPYHRAATAVFLETAAWHPPLKIAPALGTVRQHRAATHLAAWSSAPAGTAPWEAESWL